MKIILSRKGFDSAYGGYPSPILPNGKMVSLPIPDKGDFIKYSDLKIYGKTYYDLMKQLKQKINKDDELTKDTKCHLDPDIYKESVERQKNWKPCFGQIDQSQSHLHNEGVENNDLFLFFGWFKNTILKKGILQFDKLSPDLHVIFGYLQIGEILQINEGTNIPRWMQNHPHVKNKKRKKNPTNTIYVARDNLTWEKSKPGAGIFRFNNKLVLTKKGETRSKWKLPSFFKGINISRHSDESWKKEGYFQSVPIGQEFIIEDNKRIIDWAKQIISY